MSLNDAFLALGDPTRRAILARLALGEATVTELAEPHDLAQPTISKHLKVLEQAGLIETRIVGTARPRRLRPEGLKLVDDWLTPFRTAWERRFERLESLLGDTAQHERKANDDNSTGEIGE